MASSTPWVQYAPGFKVRNGNLGSSSSQSSASTTSSASCSSSSPSSSFDNRQGVCCSWNLCNLTGLNNIWKHQSLRAQAMSTTQGNVASPSGLTTVKDEPDHLLVLVHGIFASPSDWIYVETELKRRLGRNFLIYASSCNTYTKTFDGIDGGGKRLADEVMQVVKRTESLKRISFLAHSLGGLFTRYAIAILYSPDAFSSDQSNDVPACTNANSKTACSSRRGMIAGLEPVNFITLATPHLGVRGKKQLPFLLGLPILEKLAPSVAPIFAGRTGSQLFLTDGKPNKPPLLLRMTSDCEDGKFISALGAFRCRILYANVSYDHMVGWRTSSIRRETELFKGESNMSQTRLVPNTINQAAPAHPLGQQGNCLGPSNFLKPSQQYLLKFLYHSDISYKNWQPPRQSLDGYKHIVDVQYCPAVSSEGPHFPPEAAKAKEAAQNAPNTENTVEYHEIMEEGMIRGLQQLGWKKVDVSFHSAFWPFSAHNNIHVKNEWLHNAGAGVVAHVADSIKQEEMQQDSNSFIAASMSL